MATIERKIKRLNGRVVKRRPVLLVRFSRGRNAARCGAWIRARYEAREPEAIQVLQRFVRVVLGQVRRLPAVQ